MKHKKPERIEIVSDTTVVMHYPARVYPNMQDCIRQAQAARPSVLTVHTVCGHVPDTTYQLAADGQWHAYD
jgi:hypothetical protein